MANQGTLTIDNNGLTGVLTTTLSGDVGSVSYKNWGVSIEYPDFNNGKDTQVNLCRFTGSYSVYETGTIELRGIVSTVARNAWDINHNIKYRAFIGTAITPVSAGRLVEISTTLSQVTSSVSAYFVDRLESGERLWGLCRYNDTSPNATYYPMLPFPTYDQDYWLSTPINISYSPTFTNTGLNVTLSAAGTDIGIAWNFSTYGSDYVGIIYTTGMDNIPFEVNVSQYGISSGGSFLKSFLVDEYYIYIQQSVYGSNNPVYSLNFGWINNLSALSGNQIDPYTG